jgi:hypothetical protein
MPASDAVDHKRARCEKREERCDDDQDLIRGTSCHFGPATTGASLAESVAAKPLTVNSAFDVARAEKLCIGRGRSQRCFSLH